MQALKEVRKELRNIIFFGLKMPKPVVIQEMPTEWTALEGIGGENKGIFGHDTDNSIMLYRAPKGLRFPAHFELAIESFIVLQGLVKLKTIYLTRTLKAGDSTRIPPDTGHSAKFLEDSVLLLVWHPAFKEGVGWEGHQTDLAPDKNDN